MNDYYIASDMNGHYAIVHGIEWKNHKYIKKIGEGKTAIYFYTLKELQGYLSNVRNRMQKTGESAATAGARVAQTFNQKSGTALTTAKTAGNRVYGITRNAVNNGVEVVKAQTQRLTVPKASGAAPAQETRQASENKSVQSVVNRAVQAAGKVMSGIQKVTDIKVAAVKRLNSAAEKTIGALRNKAGEFSEKLQQRSKSKTETGNSASSLSPAASNATVSAPAEAEAQASRPTAHQKNVTGSAKAGWSKRRDMPGKGNQPNPVQDLQEYANQLIDPDISVSSDKEPKDQIKEYSAGVDAKIEQLTAAGDQAATDQYTKEQLFVIGAMCSSQYYASKAEYERSENELEKFAQEVNKARREYEKANNEFSANRSKMSRAERAAAKEQLQWKKDMLSASVSNYDRQQALVLSYYNDMNFYKEVLTSCTDAIEQLQPQAIPQPQAQPMSMANPGPIVTPSAPLHIDVKSKR